MAKRNLFSFNAETETPETLAERRARADALASQIGNATTVGGGIGDIFRGLGAGLSRYRTDSAQREGQAAGRSAMDEFLGIMDAPPMQPMTTPSNDAVRESLKTGIATGKVPPLASYTPGGPQNAGRPDSRPAPAYAPPMASAPPVAEEQAPAPVQPAPAPTAGPNRKVMAQMAAILRNPWVPEADKAMVRQRYEDMLKKSDPDYQYEQQTKRTKDAMDIAKGKIELHNLQNPDRPVKDWTDPNTGDLYVYEPHDPVGTKKLLQKAGPKAAEGKPPTVETLYDEKTGQSYKAQWNPETRNWDRVGGNKADENGITITNPDGTTTQIGGSGKAGGKMTEADQRARLLAEQVVAQEPQLMADFDTLATLQNSVGGATGMAGRGAMTPEGQMAKDSLTNVLANWLYLTSGATMSPAEIDRQINLMMPSPLDHTKTVEAKKARVQSIFNTMRLRANIPPAGAVPAPKAPVKINGYTIEEVP